MIQNYFKTAWRNLIRNKIFSVINIGGLALGLTAFWLIALLVADDLSYDRYHKKADRIFRLVSHGKWDGGSFDITGTSGPTAGALKNDYPEVVQTTRLDAEGGGIISYEQKRLIINDIFFADSSFFSVFSHHFLAGDPNTSLSKPESIVLTKDLAINLFGSVDAALNKIIHFQNNLPNMVTGVIDNVPGNSHFTFKAIRSFYKNFNPDWSNFYLYTYILLKNKEDGAALQKKMPDFVKKYLYSKGLDIKYSIELQPLTSIHLHSNLSYELGANKSIRFVYIFSIIGLLILCIAFINYINITTARASVRLREIAVRKVIGSGRANLVHLFLIESVLVTLCATLLSVVLAKLFMPVFNQLTGKELELWNFGIYKTIMILFVFALLAGMAGGIYPAFFLSGFKTIPALKNQMGKQNFQILFRKSLVVFQFTITVIMIAVTLIIYSQLHFMTSKDLGFDKNQILTFHLDNNNIRMKGNELRNSLLAAPFVKEVAFAGNPLGNNNIGQMVVNVENNGVIDPNLTMTYGLQIDENYIPTMRIRMAQGRNFNEHLANDSNTIIINKAFAEKLGWKNAIGKRVAMGKDSTDKQLMKTVIGVTNDFHIYSLQHRIEPMIMQLPSSAKEKDNVYVRISEKKAGDAVRFIETTFKKFDGETPFEYHFLDQNFKKQYQAEEKQGLAILVFTMLTIGIACLGLFGLITFATTQRVKEIGIRKVLGASPAGLVKLLSGDMMRLIIISLIIAIPLAWYIMNLWLQDFAYRINVSWWMLALSAVIGIFIAGITLSFQAIKAALANPIKSLRTE